MVLHCSACLLQDFCNLLQVLFQYALCVLLTYQCRNATEIKTNQCTIRHLKQDQHFSQILEWLVTSLIQAIMADKDSWVLVSM